MHISQITITNFRLFGTEQAAFKISLGPGLTALVGENDTGKTAVMDALRLVLGTRDQESLRLDPIDFHQASDGHRAREIRITLKFSELTLSDCCTFAEYLTYRADESSEIDLILTWTARRTDSDGPGRRFTPIEWRTGENADGPLLDASARFLLQATYLRPLRDAERAMTAGRGSRLAQILQHTREIRDHGSKFDASAQTPLDPTTLSVLGIGDYTNYLIENSQGIGKTREKLNQDYLRPLSFNGDPLDARVRISSHRDDGIRLRVLLEKLEVNLGHAGPIQESHSRGLGSNNILFMACELLLLGAEAEGFPLLLIEEPEAHLHPQRQIRLLTFLQEQASKRRDDGQTIQIIVSTHSPTLASEVKLDNLILIRSGQGYSMAPERTKLTKSDYRFLQRFLDATKANLFFARGVVIVEGDAENILLPVLAKLAGRDFEEYGVSIVNVGGVGLSRYGRIFMREDPQAEGSIPVRVACVTDLDVMPNCAPEILGKIKAGEPIPQIQDSKRRWRIKSDYQGQALCDRREYIRSKANEQCVRTFVANEWTLEYDLAYFGLSRELHTAIHLADHDDKINDGTLELSEAIKSAEKQFEELLSKNLSKEETCSHIYRSFTNSSPVSKPITAQYLSNLLEDKMKEKQLTTERLRELLPPYLKEVIEYVTQKFDTSG